MKSSCRTSNENTVASVVVMFVFCLAGASNATQCDDCGVVANCGAAMNVEADVVVYGATSAGISAAMQVTRMGRKAVLVEPTNRIGGLTTGGLGSTDIGNKGAFGGIARSFYRAVCDWYSDESHWTRQKRDEFLKKSQSAAGEETMWDFEPSVALKILEAWECKEGLTILRGKRICRGCGKVKMEEKGGAGRRIVSFSTEDGTEFHGRVFIDATYEGDLLAEAGVSFVVGREANSKYNETLNGMQRVRANSHQFMPGVSGYRIAGDPASGLLPGLERDVLTEDGEGDARVQAYCYRMCLTDDPENRIPFKKPAGYREEDYELLFRNLEAIVCRGATNGWTRGMPWINSPMPNRKTDTNNCSGFSLDFVGGNWDYPNASYEERAKIEEAHLRYQQGLMWTLANHPRVPAYFRGQIAKWGTCRDEFVGERGDGWQNQLYVREARRMVGEYVMTEANCVKTRVAERPVALAAYQMDSHHVRRYVDADGAVRNEGDVQVRCSAGPFGIDYGAIVPKRGECANLLVPVCISSSHIAFGSIRMEPVFFALGQAAGTAAAQAADSGSSVQDLDYAALRARLLADGQVLEFAESGTGAVRPELALTAGEKIPLVVPEARTPAEKTAARELVEYVGRVTGATLEVVPETAAPNGPAIHLGATAFARQVVSGLNGYGAEEWTVKAHGNHLVIAGGVPRGTLYAAYHFLEDVLGVHWLSPAKDGDYVPSRPRVAVAGVDLHGRPPMPYRSIYNVPGEMGSLFLSRNRMNAGGAERGEGKDFGGSSDCHTLYSNLGSPDDVRVLYKEHPEWFPIIDGRRYCDVDSANGRAQSQLCLTNPDLRRHWVAKLREKIVRDVAAARKSGVPVPRYYAVDQNDCYDGYCQCEDCQAIAKREESNAGILLDFANHVAAELEEVAEGGRFQMMAYHSTAKPPKHMRARHNVTIRLCDTTSNEVAPWTDPQNQKLYDKLKAWGGRSDAISMWDYQITYGATSVICFPTPSERTFAADIRTLRDSKGEGFFFEHESPVGADMRDLKVWLELKLVENPDLDGPTLVRTFTDLYYGEKAGAIIRKYRDFLGELADAAKARIAWFPALSDYGFLTGEVVRDAYRLRFEALEAVRGDEKLVRRVAHAFFSLDRYYLARSGALRRSLAKRDAAAALPDPAKVKARLDKIFRYEAKNRCYDLEQCGYKKEIAEFLDFVGKARELPVPPMFANVDGRDLTLIPADFARTFFDAVKLVDDPLSSAGRALVADMRLVEKTGDRRFRLDAYDWPLKMTIWPTMDGSKDVTLGARGADLPRSYRWYKIGENLRLRQDSMVGVFSGAVIPLDGVVMDNWELGQRYDVYVSLRVEGPDIAKTGKAAGETVYFVDQVAAVRKTHNSGP